MIIRLTDQVLKIKSVLNKIYALNKIHGIDVLKLDLTSYTDKDEYD